MLPSGDQLKWSWTDTWSAKTDEASLSFGVIYGKVRPWHADNNFVVTGLICLSSTPHKQLLHLLINKLRAPMYALGCLSKTLNEILNMMIFATNSLMPLGKKHWPVGAWGGVLGLEKRMTSQRAQPWPCPALNLGHRSPWSGGPEGRLSKWLCPVTSSWKAFRDNVVRNQAPPTSHNIEEDWNLRRV